MLPNKDSAEKENAIGRKISATMKARKIDNFKEWRNAHRIHYARIPHNGDLAEYIGVVLGDGHIEKLPRTERIVISGDARKPQFIYRYAAMTESLFKKTPTIERASKSNGLRLSLYQKFISARLGISTGNKEKFPHKLPLWIEENEAFLIRFLRGLYEAEASLSIHLPTCTYNFEFTNYNPFLLKIVETALRRLEFHPEVRNNAIRVRRMAEVERLKNLLQFRRY
jgi:hypothetical protein